ncbi:electron transport complex subunit RsxG [Kaarinaea lacus]
MQKTRQILTTGFLLASFAVIGTGLVAFTYDMTKDQIAEAERQALLQSLHSVVPQTLHDNELINDQITVTSQQYLGTKEPMSIFRARQYGQPVAAILTAVAPDGYNGKIKILIGVSYEGEILGVRVVDHRETPGLGDAIETRRSDWILGFDGKSTQIIEQKQWRVKKDGGAFDQLTGATITPRAIVKAVFKALSYYEINRDMIFNEPTAKEQAS